MPVVTPSVTMEVSSNACVGPREDCSGLLSCHTALWVCLWGPLSLRHNYHGCHWMLHLSLMPACQTTFLPFTALSTSVQPILFCTEPVFLFLGIELFLRASQMVLVVKSPSANAEYVRDVGSVPGSGRSPGGGHGNALQYCCLENLMDRRAWWATVHRATKSRT